VSSSDDDVEVTCVSVRRRWWLRGWWRCSIFEHNVLLL